MEHKELGWQTKDGLELYAQCWQPGSAPKGALLLVHGIGEHTGRYAHLGAFFAEHGYAVIGHDLRGHGKSGGRRGHFPSYDALMDDIDILVEKAGERYPRAPKVFYGHSLGGGQVINYLLRRKPVAVKLAIASAPYLRLAFEPPAFKVFLGRMMDKVWPTFTQATGLETAALARDPQVVQDYIDDPLVHALISARGFVNIYTAGIWALEHADQLNMPLLIMQGNADRLISIEASREFAERAGSLCEFRVWEDFYHELHNEPEQGEVMAAALDWIEKHIH